MCIETQSAALIAAWMCNNNPYGLLNCGHEAPSKTGCPRDKNTEMYHRWFNLYKTFYFCMTLAMGYFLASIKSSTVVSSGDSSKTEGSGGERKAQLH